MKFKDLLNVTGEWTEETKITLVVCSSAPAPSNATTGEIDKFLGQAEVITFSKDLVVLKVSEDELEAFKNNLY